MNNLRQEIEKSIKDLEFQCKFINILRTGLQYYQGIALIGLIILVILNIFYNYTVVQNILSAFSLVLIIIVGWWGVKVYDGKIDRINVQIQGYLNQLRQLNGK